MSEKISNAESTESTEAILESLIREVEEFPAVQVYIKLLESEIDIYDEHHKAIMNHQDVKMYNTLVADLRESRRKK